MSLYTDALFGKEAQLTLDRIPSPTGSAGFNTTPVLVYDTTFYEVLKTTARVYSRTNMNNPNRTCIKINLPPNTSYWCYWIGVDQEAQQEMKQIVSKLTPAMRAFSVNPLVLFGMKMLPVLPMMNTPSTVDYKFINTPNSQAFLNGDAYNYYSFKHANSITTDYSIIRSGAGDIVLAMENNNLTTGYNVEVRIVAFTITPKLSIQ